MEGWRASKGLSKSEKRVHGHAPGFEGAVQEKRWSDAVYYLDQMAHTARVYPDSIDANEICFVGELADNPRLRKSALKMLQAAAERVHDTRSAAKLWNQAAKLAENSNKPEFANDCYSRAFQNTSPSDLSLRSTISLNRAYLAIRRGRLGEGLTYLPFVTTNTPEFEFALLEIQSAVSAMSSFDLREYSDLLLELAGRINAQASYGNPAGLLLAARAIHTAFYVELRQNRISSARVQLRALEKCALTYSANTSFLDPRAGNIAVIFSLAQMEFAVFIRDRTQVERSLHHLASTRARVEVAVGRGSGLAVSLDFNEALAKLWLLRASDYESNIDPSLHGELLSRAKYLSVTIGRSYPEALSAGGLLSDALLQSGNMADGSLKIRESSKSNIVTGPNRDRRREPEVAERLRKMSSSELVSEFGLHEQDTGRIEVQIALLHQRILSLTKHLQDAKNDHASRRGLFLMVGKRRRLLKYLENESIERYRTLVYQLALRR